MTFGVPLPNFCAACRCPVGETYFFVLRRPRFEEDDPDGYDACPECGSDDVRVHEETAPYRVVRRRRLSLRRRPIAA